MGVGSRHRPRLDWKPAAASADRPRMSVSLQSFLPCPNSCQGTSPYQQGRGTKMTEHCYCGIDVAKDRLDAQVLPHRQGFSVDNNATGWAELVERLHALAIAAVGIEPSGGYERGIIRTLLAAGPSVRPTHPNNLRQAARARGILAKNDRLDAQLISEYVSIMPTRAVQRAATAERLAEVVTMRRQLCDQHVTIENQAAHVEDAILRCLNKRRLVRLKADIHLLDKRLAEIVAADVILAQRYELLTSMRGVGPTLAFTLTL